MRRWERIVPDTLPDAGKAGRRSLIAQLPNVIYAGTCMSPKTRLSGAPKFWLPGSAQDSCRLITTWADPG